MYIDKDKRAIYYCSDITEELAAWFMYNFNNLDRNDGGISLIMSSVGGNYDTACVPMVDTILAANNHITGYCYGANASSQAFILLACDTRYLSSERSYITLHAGTGGEVDMDLREFQKEAKIVEYQMQQDMKYYSERSNRPPSYYSDEIAKGDFYIYPDKAVEIGLIHGIKTYTN